MKFLSIIIILFLHCCCLPCEMKFHHGLMSWNFFLGIKSWYKQPLWWSFSILDVWLGSECASECWVGDNDAFVKFLIQPYLLLFLHFSGDSKLHLFQLFWFSMKLIHLHYTWQQNLIKKFGDVSSNLSLHNSEMLL